MKKRMLAALLALLVLLLSGCGVTEGRRKVVINANLAGTATFAFGTDTPGEGVDVTGSIITQKDKTDAVVTILAHIQSGEEHQEGVSFYAKKGWVVTNVLTDYPADGNEDQKYNNAVIVKTATAESDWAYIVEFGCDRTAAVPGAEGDVMIELTWNYGSFEPDSFDLLACVGAGYPSGTTADGKTAVEVSIPLD